MTPLQFHESLMAYCRRLNGSTTSYGRTVKHNHDVGGVPQSAHQFWLGADVVYDGPVAGALAADTAARLKLRVIRESDHDHLQPIDWSAG